MPDNKDRHERKTRPFRDEIYLDGGVYFEGRDGIKDDEDRTDISVNESGERGDKDNPLSYTINITSGNCTYAWVGISPKDLKRIGKFLIEQSGE